MRTLRRLLLGGSAGNEQLTAILAALLLPLLAIEGATLLRITSLLDVHAFVGMMLMPVVSAKLATVGWRMARYYRGREEYVVRGPPHVTLRIAMAPLLVASTVVLFGTGVALLVVGQANGSLVGLHKASFVVWVAAMSVHVLTRALPALRALRRRLPAIGLRIGIASVSLVAGVMLATVTLPAVDHLRDNVSGSVGFDSD